MNSDLTNVRGGVTLTDCGRSGRNFQFMVKFYNIILQSVSLKINDRDSQGKGIQVDGFGQEKELKSKSC